MISPERNVVQDEVQDFASESREVQACHLSPCIAGRLIRDSFGHQGNKSEGTALRRRRGTLSPFAWASIPKRRTACLKYFFILSLLGITPVCIDFFKFDWANRTW
jgi:hypothetical protein